MKTEITKCITTKIKVEFDAPIHYDGNAIHRVIVQIDELHPCEKDEDPIEIDATFVGRSLTTRGQEDQRQQVGAIYGIHKPWRYALMSHILRRNNHEAFADRAWIEGHDHALHFSKDIDDEALRQRVEQKLRVDYANTSNEVLAAFFGTKREEPENRESRAPKPRIAHVTGPEVDKVIDAITRGTTNWRDRRNPKVLRCLHITDKYALVEFKGGTYHCHGPNYANGHVDLVRIPQDLSTTGGHSFWEVTKGTVVTPKRLRKMIEAADSLDMNQPWRDLIAAMKQLTQPDAAEAM